MDTNSFVDDGNFLAKFLTLSDLKAKFAVVDGAEHLQAVTEKMITNLANRSLSFGTDFDGTLIHALPGEHVDVPSNPFVTNLLNNLNRVADAYGITGRPDIFTTNTFVGREFLVGTEHGSVVSEKYKDEVIVRIGDPQIMSDFGKEFSRIQSGNELLKDVQIEEHKSVTGTLGFTHVINPNNDRKLTDAQAQLMVDMEEAVISCGQAILDNLGAEGINIVPTVTPTNAVIEIMPEGACKAESLQWLRDEGYVQSDMLPAFAGDSNGDASVMQKVFSEGGICLGVGPKAPKSHVVFEAPENLAAYLDYTLQQAVAQKSDLKQHLNLKMG